MRCKTSFVVFVGLTIFLWSFGKFLFVIRSETSVWINPSVCPRLQLAVDLSASSAWTILPPDGNHVCPAGNCDWTVMNYLAWDYPDKNQDHTAWNWDSVSAKNLLSDRFSLNRLQGGLGFRQFRLLTDLSKFPAEWLQFQASHVRLNFRKGNLYFRQGGLDFRHFN